MLGTASERGHRHELARRRMRWNSGTRECGNSRLMAEAMKHAVIAGRGRLLAAGMPEKTLTLRQFSHASYCAVKTHNASSAAGPERYGPGKRPHAVRPR